MNSFFSYKIYFQIPLIRYKNQYRHNSRIFSKVRETEKVGLCLSTSTSLRINIFRDINWSGIGHFLGFDTYFGIYFQFGNFQEYIILDPHFPERLSFQFLFTCLYNSFGKYQEIWSLNITNWIYTKTLHP